MSSTKKEFRGNDVAEAIKNACTALKVPQEHLNIEILHTGSAGIFGLCRQKTLIRVSLRQEQAPAQSEVPLPGTGTKTPKGPKKQAVRRKDQGKTASPDLPTTEEKRTPIAKEKAPHPNLPRKEEVSSPIAIEPEDIKPSTEALEVEEINPETLDAIKTHLTNIMELSGLIGTIAISSDQNSVLIHIDGDHVEEIVGPEGRTLDAIQYLLRKIISKKFSEKILLSLDAGDFRAKRMEDLKVQGVQLAEEVKKDGKTRSIPSLNPSERRIVHMTLQGDKEIRSRSVGEGLLKKVLIYQPGKGKSRPRRRNRDDSKGPAKS